MSDERNVNLAEGVASPVMLICFGCQQKKSSDNFHKSRKTRTGFCTYCKPCRSKYRKDGRPSWPSIQDRTASATSKPCKMCGTDKPLDEFHIARNGKCGRAARCKDCMKVIMDEYTSRPEVKARVRERMAGSYAKLSSEKKAAHVARVRRYQTESPMHSLKKSLMRALVRRPTNNPITAEQLIQMWHDQDGKCAVSGLAMTWGQGWYSPTSISIDRINSDKGYTKDNVRLICYSINTFKGKWTDVEIFEIAKAIVANMTKKAEQKIEPKADLPPSAPDILPFTFVA